MIKYDLGCSNEHTFEVWFRDSAACDEQIAAGEVLCPHCGVTDVHKALMAPAINKAGHKDPERKRAVAMAQQMHLLREFRRRQRLQRLCMVAGDGRCWRADGDTAHTAS